LSSWWLYYTVSTIDNVVVFKNRCENLPLKSLLRFYLIFFVV
jgi:hypothetical protein